MKCEGENLWVLLDLFQIESLKLPASMPLFPSLDYTALVASNVWFSTRSANQPCQQLRVDWKDPKKTLKMKLR